MFWCIFKFLLFSFIFLKKGHFYLLVLERERKEEKERNIDLLFYLFMCSLVDSCICCDGRAKLQHWLISTMPYPSELHGQDYFGKFFKCNLKK